MAPAAFADQIGDAAKKLGDASYDFAKEVDWNNGVFLQAPGIRALGGWARGLAVGLGRVMFAWDLSLSNKIRTRHDVSDSTHQITCWAVDRIMYVYSVHGYRIYFLDQQLFWFGLFMTGLCRDMFHHQTSSTDLGR